jgi:uncharacterized membrane protein YkoI
MKTLATRLSAVLALVLVAGVLLPSGVRSSNAGSGDWMRVNDWEDEGHSHDRARRASEAGEILTIAEIYERALQEHPGRVLEAELEPSSGRWIYELKILDPAGRLYELKLDAATGEILRRKEEHD